MRLQHIIITLALACLAGTMPSRAAEALKLPFLILDRNELTVSHTTVTFNSKTYKAYDLADVPKSGKVYWLPDERALLLDNATVESNASGSRAWFESYATNVMLIYVRGNNTLNTGLRTAFRTWGPVSMQGDNTGTATVTINNQYGMIYTVGTLSISNLALKGTAKTFGLRTEPSDKGQRLLSFYSAGVDITTRNDMVGFSDLETIQCGLATDYYWGKSTTFNKAKKGLYMGSNYCSKLKVVRSGGYYIVDTRSTAATGSYNVEAARQQKASTTATAATTETLPFTINGSNQLQVTKGRQISWGSTKVDVCELTKVPGLTRGQMYYAPGTKQLFLYNVTLNGTSDKHCLYFPTAYELCVMGRCIINAPKAAIRAEKGLTVKGLSTSQSSLNITSRGSVACSATGTLSIASLTLNISTAEYALCGMRNASDYLLLSRVAGTWSSRVCVVANFNNVVTSLCGIPGQAAKSTSQSSSAVNYKEWRMYRGSDLCKTLTLSADKYTKLTGTPAEKTSSSSGTSSSSTRRPAASSGGTSVSRTSSGSSGSARKTTTKKGAN